VASDGPSVEPERLAPLQPAPPYLVLLRAGFCLPPTLPPARCALTAPFHPYLSYPRRYVFCATNPSSHPARALPGALPCGVRTFLPPSPFRATVDKPLSRPAAPKHRGAKAGDRLADCDTSIVLAAHAVDLWARNQGRYGATSRSLRGAQMEARRRPLEHRRCSSDKHCLASGVAQAAVER